MKSLCQGVLLCLVVGTAAAGVPLDWFANPQLATEEPVSVYTLPGGDGHPLESCCRFGGQAVDASIDLTIQDYYRQNIAFLPAEDLWLHFGGSHTLVLCDGGAIADHATDALGRTSFSGPFYGGGAFVVDPGTNNIYLNSPVGDTCMDWIFPQISINSPDINSDLVVNLTDVVLFTGDFFGGTYDYRSDFYWDGQINLSDIVLLARGWLSTCP